MSKKKKRGPWGCEEDLYRQQTGEVPMRFVSWTFEIKVAECWVSDGFNPDADRIHDMVMTDLGYSRGEEIQVRMVKDAPQGIVAQCQGYVSAAHMKQKNPKRAKVCRG